MALETTFPHPVRDSHWEPSYASRAARLQASEIRELLKLLEQPNIISFAGGIPDPDLFPKDAVREAYRSVLDDDGQAGRTLQYSISEGDPHLRAWIAGHMASKGVTCTTENILITSGSQQALEFVGKLLLSPSDTALVTAPTYLGALQAFSACEPAYDQLQPVMGNRTAPAYRDTAKAAGGAVKLAYVVPDFANPTGETLTREGRQSLLSLSRELDIPIIEDAAYAALRYDGADIAPVQALDVADTGSIDASRVIYCGTFSKVFTPGLRVGWICASKPIIHRLTLIKQASDLNSAAINQAVMRHLAETRFDDQVAQARRSYRLKRDAMLAALSRHMPEGTQWTEPEGGLFVWVTLPSSINAADLLKRSVAEAGVAFVPGHAFFADGSGTNTLRLSFSLPDVQTIDHGIEKLACLT